MIVYITKYALSKGIQKYEVSENHIVSEDIEYSHILIRGARYNEEYFKPDWHTNKEESLIQAELMRLKKISSLSKQIVKLRGLKFKVK